MARNKRDEELTPPTRRDALRMFGLTALAGLAPAASLGALFDTASAEAQDGPTRAALFERFRDGRIAVAPRAVHGAPGARIIGQVDAEFRDTIAALLAFGAYRSTFALWLRRVRVLSRARGRARLYADVEVIRNTPSTWVELDVVIRGDADGTHRVELSRVRGDLATFHVVWQFISTPGRMHTLASLDVAVAPHISLPTSTLQASNLDVARLAFASIRRAAKSHGQRRLTQGPAT